MRNTTILENSIIEEYKKCCYINLSVEKCIVEKNFSWLNFNQSESALFARGELEIGTKSYSIELMYSPFLPYRFERIYVKNQNVRYNKKIHVYSDLSLCLYHPIIDKPFLKLIPLFKMIPWITEWCIHYEEWKKYGVWLGKEINH